MQTSGRMRAAAARCRPRPQAPKFGLNAKALILQHAMRQEEEEEEAEAARAQKRQRQGETQRLALPAARPARASNLPFAGNLHVLERQPHPTLPGLQTPLLRPPPLPPSAGPSIWLPWM